MRWHVPTCITPNVIVRDSDKLPYCNTCNQTCPTTESLVASQAPGSGGLNIPPDEKFGEMELWWPLCVPYKRRRRPGDGDEDHSESAPGSKRTATSTAGNSSTKRRKNSMSTRHSQIYGRTLQLYEIRLALLPEASDPDEPLHLTLERFSEDYKPEYETVSYTWGGEDGDSTPCQPVYIGSYWDILLQTKNCCSMLQFMRPWRGIRTIWVDALCINQEDSEEREAQVSKMRQIYEQCSRVVVYLGSDLVAMNRSFPIQKPLDELPRLDSKHFKFPSGHLYGGRAFTLPDLLKRRYFSRVWVIQELLQPERVLFRIGNVNLHTDVTVMARLAIFQKDYWTEAPWVQHLGLKEFPNDAVNDIYSLINLTVNSHASDPRDRLYGVVSLLQNETQRQEFPTDYSISCQHYFIGIFGHWILDNDLHQVQILRKAGLALRSTNTEWSRSVPSSLPSWVPDCRTAEAWREVITLSSSATVSPKIGTINKALCKMHLERHGEGNIYCSVLHSFSEGQAKTSSRQWNRNAYIEAETGALSVNLVHLFAIPAIPLYVTSIGDSGIFEIQSQRQGEDLPSSKLYLATQAHLPSALQGDEHVFLLKETNTRKSGKFGQHHLYLILRPERSLGSSHTDEPYYRLISPCSYVFTEQLGMSEEQLMEMEGSWKDGINYVDFSTIQVSVADHIGYIHDSIISLKRIDREFLDNDFRAPSMISRHVIADHMKDIVFLVRWQQLFPGAKTLEVMQERFLTLYQPCYMSEQQCNPTHLQDAYLTCIDEKYKAKVEDGFLELQFTADDWEAHMHKIYILPNVAPHPASYRKVHERNPTREAHRRQHPGENLVFSLLDSFYRFDWEWKHAPEPTGHDTIWQSTLDESLYQSQQNGISMPIRTSSAAVQGNIRIRAPIAQILNVLWDETNEARSSMAKIVAAYSPPLTFEALREIVKQGPTEEQQFIGVPKIFGGVVMDGSTYRVNIV